MTALPNTGAGIADNETGRDLAALLSVVTGAVALFGGLGLTRKRNV